MSIEEMRNEVAQNLGLEVPLTIAFFTICETCDEDTVFAVYNGIKYFWNKNEEIA